MSWMLAGYQKSGDGLSVTIMETTLDGSTNTYTLTSHASEPLLTLKHRFKVLVLKDRASKATKLAASEAITAALANFEDYLNT